MYENYTLSIDFYVKLIRSIYFRNNFLKVELILLLRSIEYKKIFLIWLFIWKIFIWLYIYGSDTLININFAITSLCKNLILHPCTHLCIHTCMFNFFKYAYNCTNGSCVNHTNRNTQTLSLVCWYKRFLCLDYKWIKS